jgi:hypothetical protein
LRHRIQQPRLALLFALIGGLGFWLPDVAMHAYAGRNFDSPHVRLMTFLMPTAFLFAFLVAQRLAVKQDYKWFGAAMLLGIWLSGGLFMALAATVSGGGFAGPDGVWGGFLMTALGLLPPITFMQATYDGSLFALLAVTFAVVLWGIWTSHMPLPFRRRAK